MYTKELIDKYFSPHPDKSLDDKFRQGAGFFNNRNCVYSIERIDRDKIRIFFKDRMEFRDQAIIENGKKVGIARLATPHTIQTRAGTFICSGVKKIVKNPPTDKWRTIELTISKKF